MADMSAVKEEYSSTNFDKDDWNDFDGFQEDVSSGKQPVNDDGTLPLPDSVPKNCANAQIVAANELVPDKELSTVNLPDLLARCFCRTANIFDQPSNSNCTSSFASMSAAENILVGNA